MRVRSTGLAGILLLIVSVAVAAGGLAACADPSSGGRASYGAEWAAWAGQGRWAVLSTHEENGNPTVVVWDAETGAVREEPGWALGAAEPHASEVWLLKTDANSIASAEVPGPLTSGPEYDSPPASVGIWRLDEPGDGPRDDLPAKWQAWIGPQWGAYLEVDPLRGMWPARLLFNDLAMSTQGHKAQLPTGFSTFRPVGWSATGRLFGVEECAGTGASGRSLEDARIALIDSVDGSVVATAALGSAGHGRVVWAPWTDELVWAVGSSQLSALGTDGGVRSALGPNQTPAEWADASTLEILGAGQSGLTVATTAEEGEASTNVWRVSESGVTRLASVDSEVVLQEWWEGRGLLGIRREPAADKDSEHVVFVLLDESGAERELWRSEPRKGSGIGSQP